MEIRAIPRLTKAETGYFPNEKLTPTKDLDLEEGVIAALGKNVARKTSRYPQASAKTKTRKPSKPPLTAKKIREREERRKKAICHWCKETGHYQRQCPEYVQCHLQFLRKKGIEVHDQDLDRNAMEIAAMAEGPVSYTHLTLPTIYSV